MEQLNKKVINSLITCCNELQRTYEKLDNICSTNNIVLVNIFTYLDHILNPDIHSIHISKEIAQGTSIEALADIVGQEIIEFDHGTKGFVYKGVKFYILPSEDDNE